MAQVTEFVRNIPLQVAAALRYIDANGDLVTQLYPNDYLSLVGSAAGTLKTEVAQINQILIQYGATLISLQTQITNILTSGATHIPNVNGGCLNGSIVIPVDTATTLLIANTCSYNSVLGTTTRLAEGILAEDSAYLNSAPAFSQNSAMAGLSGWDSDPTTVGDSLVNIWKAYNDARAGISKVLAAVTPTCAQVIINYQATYNSSDTSFSIYFNGYSFIPLGFTDNGSTIQITDGGGGILLSSFDIVTQSTSGPLVLNTSGSTLSTNAEVYTVQINSNVTNVSLGLTCVKTIVQTIDTQSTSFLPSMGNYTAVTSGTTFSLVNDLGFSPRFGSITAKNSFTAAAIQSVGYWLIYTDKGLTISFGNPIGYDELNIDWIAYR